MTTNENVPAAEAILTDEATIELVASDVFKKFGFQDGCLFDDALDDAGIDHMMKRAIDDDMFEDECLGDAVLTRIVVDRVGGLLPAGAIGIRQSASHNPVRAEETEANKAALQGVRFQVPVSEVVEVARSMAPEFSSDASAPRL